MTLRLAGVAARLKLGGDEIVRAIVVFAVRLPEVPVIVTVAVLGRAELATVKVTMWADATVAKVAVTPVGSPEAASATVPVKPL